MPHANPIVEYLDGQCQFKVPFIMYADLESILDPIQGPGNNPSISSMRGVNILHHLGGTFIPSSLMDQSRILLNYIEERIALTNFAST